ncbi:hypothetical protein SCALM49S_04644 [Streptomyces californicus]
MAGRWIETREPEDTAFWRETGERVARRNLWFSVLFPSTSASPSGPCGR